MALSFKEKRDLQKEWQEKIKAAKETSNFREKREIQARIREIRSLLHATEVKQKKTLLERLQAGEFDGLSPVDYLAQLRLVCDSIPEGDISPVIEPAIAYVKKHESELVDDIDF